MTNMHDSKTLEAKVRPWHNPKERSDLKGVARVHLSSQALQDLGLKPEQTCYIWKTGEAPEKRREAVVWYSHDNSMRKNVIQMSKTFQDVCNLKLGDDLTISASGSLAVAETIILKDLTAQEESSKELPESDRPVWEAYIADSLCTWNLYSLHAHALPSREYP
jgi:AAA family ATPase